MREDDTLARIRTLAIPPAWMNVWISPRADGHIQATGLDTKKRKQYRYHAQWNVSRNETKYHRLYEFGKTLPGLRKKVQHDISSITLTKEKVLATVVSLMEHTSIRVGNSEYEKLYGSFGLTTLKDNHVNINGSAIKFSFKGKKGIFHTITLKNKRLAKIVKACRDIPGKELFQYLNVAGERCSIDSGMVNEYIKGATAEDFSAKDFRTWTGSVSFLNCLQVQQEAFTITDTKKNILTALDEVSVKLGNTRTVCRKYYVHPSIIKLYEENGLASYFKKLKHTLHDSDNADLADEEKVLMKILSKG